MKRLSFVFSVVLAVSMILSACGSSTPTAAPSTQPPATMPPATTAPATQPPAGGEPDVCKSDAMGCAVIDAGQTIKIGMGAPMTGDNAAFGVDISQGAMLAMKDAGDFQGFTFELDAQDDGGTAEGGAAVANKFVADPQIVAVEGHIFSGATQAAIPIYEAAGIPMMSPSATNPPLTQQGSKVFNRAVFTDGKQGAFAASYLYDKLNIKKLAILHDGTTYGKGIADVVNTEFAKLGGTVVAFQAITPGESDYSAVLADVSSKGPEGLYYGGYTAEAVVLVNQKNAAGLQNALFFSDEGMYGTDFLDRTKANGEGVYATSSPLPPDSPAKTAFDAAYESTYGTPPGKLSTYTWNAYDSGAVLIKAIESVAVVSDGKLYVPRAALVAAVRGTKDYQGISGVVSCDPTGECSASDPILNLVKDGKWEVIQ